MNRRKLIEFGIVVLVLTSAGSLQAFAQVNERTIIIKDDRRSPVEIMSVRTKGRRVESNTPFVDDDDWLKELTVDVRNASDKTLSFLQLELFFPRPRPDAKKPGTSFTLDFGDNPFSYDSAAAMPALSVKPISPGEHLEITLTDNRLSALSTLLIDTGFFMTSKVQIRVNLIGFSDGTAWSGQMVQRQPKGGWIPAGDK
jgi:hypothetical protein